MRFEAISWVIPCIEMAYDCGYTDLEQHQGFLPKVFKTHAWYPDCPKQPTKCIFIVRYVYDKNPMNTGENSRGLTTQN